MLSCCRRLDTWLRSCAACLDAASARLRSRSACLYMCAKGIVQLPDTYAQRPAGSQRMVRCTASMHHWFES